MFIVVDEENFTETVNVAAESFVQYFLAHISMLGLSDDGEKGVKSLLYNEISKIVTVFLWK